jgi:hypothetical protein
VLPLPLLLPTMDNSLIQATADGNAPQSPGSSPDRR